MPFQVFVSYSTKDLPLVEEVRSILHGSGVTVFVAEHAVAPGEPLAQRISNAIKTSDLFVLVWSKNSRESEWVSQEIGIATAAGKPVIPVVLDCEKPPGFLQGIKYLAADREPEKALLWLRANVFERAQKKQQAEGLAWLGIGAAVLFLLNQK